MTMAMTESKPRPYSCLHAYLIRHGLSMREVSIEAGLHPDQVEQICAGRRRPNPRHVRAICEVLGINPHIVRDRRQYLLEAVVIP